MTEAKTADRYTRKKDTKPVEERGWHVIAYIDGIETHPYVRTDEGLTYREAKRLAERLVMPAHVVGGPDENEDEPEAYGDRLARKQAEARS